MFDPIRILKNVRVSMFGQKTKKILRSPWLRRFLILLSLAGFMWQVFVVSIEYFSYKTTTAVAFKLLPLVKPQVTVLCVRYREVMDRKKIRRETGIKFPPTGSASDDEEEKLTVEQIFKYTPQPDRVIKSCLIHDEYGSVFESTDCDEHFNVTKYFTQEYICYYFTKKDKDNFPIEEITHATRYSFLVYEVLLTDEFRDASVMEAIVFTAGYGMPFLSRDYAAKHVIREGAKSYNDQNYLFLSGSDIVMNKLKKPYDTACVEQGETEGYGCVLPCKTQLYATINRAPGSEILKEPYKLKALADSEKKDPSIRAKVESFDKTCRKKCYFTWCYVAFSITFADPSRNPRATIGFSVNTAKQPDLYSQSLPITTFIEYFSFTMGCFGIWFGISFLSFDPRKLFPWKRRQCFR